MRFILPSRQLTLAIVLLLLVAGACLGFIRSRAVRHQCDDYVRSAYSPSAGTQQRRWPFQNQSSSAGVASFRLTYSPSTRNNTPPSPPSCARLDSLKVAPVGGTMIFRLTVISVVDVPDTELFLRTSKGIAIVKDSAQQWTERAYPQPEGIELRQPIGLAAHVPRTIEFQVQLITPGEQTLSGGVEFSNSYMHAISTDTLFLHVAATGTTVQREP